ncbi:hypothetical protein [Serratia fonticola]|uniref:Uncharacterized protein n=1 Tax=Serratia fonticola TaxID=47917 RepID=A0AAE7EH18_SERFO|nr:hypothetical protein [Serratia fonticola]QKJ58577.1 hypothetical protein G9399_09605 [Serratia fonticola]
MAKKCIIITDEEIINNLNSDGLTVDSYFIQELSTGDYTICASFQGESFDFFWEDEIFRCAVVDFLKRRGATIVSWDEYIKKLK